MKNYKKGIKKLCENAKRIEAENEGKGIKPQPLFLSTAREVDYITLDKDWDDPDAPLVPVEINDHQICFDEEGNGHWHKEVKTREATDQEIKWYRSGKYTIRDGVWVKQCLSCKGYLPVDEEHWHLREGEPYRSYCRTCNKALNRKHVFEHRERNRPAKRYYR